MNHKKGWLPPLSAVLVALATGQAGAAVCDAYAIDGYTALEGATVCFRYKAENVDPLFGSIQVSGDNIFALPTVFKALSLDGQGTVIVSATGTIEVIAKEGYRLDGINVGEIGDYRLNGEGSSVDIDAFLRVFDYYRPNPVSGVDETTFLDVSGNLTINDGDFHIWESFGGFDLTTTLWTEVNHVGLTLQNTLEAFTHPDTLIGSAMIQKKATGTEITVSVITSSEIPVPAAVWLLGSGLLGLVGVARRRKV
jgi:hypothetical protein